MSGSWPVFPSFFSPPPFPSHNQPEGWKGFTKHQSWSLNECEGLVVVQEPCPPPLLPSPPPIPPPTKTQTGPEVFLSSSLLGPKERLFISCSCVFVPVTRLKLAARLGLLFGCVFGLLAVLIGLGLTLTLT